MFSSEVSSVHAVIISCSSLVEQLNNVLATLIFTHFLQITLKKQDKTIYYQSDGGLHIETETINATKKITDKLQLNRVIHTTDKGDEYVYLVE